MRKKATVEQEIKAAGQDASKKSKAVKATETALQEAVFVQFGEAEFCIADLTEQAKAAYVAEGHRRSAIKKLALYIKPEERKAYYVVNDKATGSFEI